MPVIAMTQEMASLGKDVALGVADKLGLQLVRHEVGDMVAGRMQVKKSLIRRIREGKASKIERWAADAKTISIFDVWLMLIFGVMGYVFKKLDYPLAPMVLALVLGDAAENAFRQSMLISQGTLAIFFSKGMVASITSLALLMLFWPLISQGLSVLRGRNGKPLNNVE